MSERHFEVELSYDGRCYVEMEAENEDEARDDAEHMAYVSDLQGGSWTVEAVREYGPDGKLVEL